jgi:hypothetical protein
VAEVHDPEDRGRLVAAYPLDVTEHRRGEWSRTYGWAGPWLLPDWSRLAQDWDGVHVSAAGYLRAQEQLIRVGGGATVLAGWNPDATYWLRDVISRTEDAPEVWTDDREGRTGWHRA